ncbi:MAG TPA: FUSC family protein [Terriglobales bacterium]|nr:FUSC family protein [Terriglobales bacterium]
MWRSFARLLTQFDLNKLEPAIAFRNAVGVTLPLAIGLAIGMPLGGLAIASGALQVAYSDGHDPYSRRGFRMLAATVLCGLAVLVGGLTGRNHLLATLAVVVWGFTAGIVVLLGPDAESLGIISLVMLIIYSAQALTTSRAINAGLLALAGGLLQTALSIALWPFFRREPERRALANVYSELSHSALSPMESKQAPLATSEMTQAHDALGRIGRDHGSEAQRLWSLLNQAERLRLSLLTLSRLRNRVGRQAGKYSDVEQLENFLKLCAGVLSDIAETLITHRTPSSGTDSLRAIREFAEGYRLQDNAEAGFEGSIRKSTGHQMDAIAGQLRAAFQIATNREVLGDSETRETMPSWRTRVRDDLARLRANLTLESPAFRHAVRLAVTLGIGVVMARAISARRSYWLPMTICLVLKPEFTVTFSRGLLRMGGTIAGLLLSTALFHFLRPAIAMEVILVAIFVFLVRWIGPANYGIFAINVSALVVLLIAFTGVAPQEVIIVRGLMTLLGGVTALAAYAVWPTWEARRSSEVLAQMLDAYRAYFQAITARYLGAADLTQSELNKARLGARLARSAMESSVDRLRMEPVANAGDIRALNAMLASSHRFINASMALEGVHQNDLAPQTEALRRFSNDVEETLELLSAALREQDKTARDRPDLREDHHSLMSALGTGNYTLLADETDRITNSLNTLSEQVLAWRTVNRAAPILEASPA